MEFCPWEKNENKRLNSARHAGLDPASSLKHSEKHWIPGQARNDKTEVGAIWIIWAQSVLWE